MCAVTGGIVLAIVCVATLVWFVHHIATGINVEKVVDAVHDDLIESIRSRNTSSPDPIPVEFEQGQGHFVSGSSYLQVIDLEEPGGLGG